MKVKGIDDEKCIACKACVDECRRFVMDETQTKVLYSDPDKTCSDCAHCIAICPENAILHDDYDDSMIEIDSIPVDLRTIPYDTLFNVMRTHRSIRRYTPEPVPRSVLEKVLNAMRCAPTAGNMRNERYTVISNQEALQNLSAGVIDELMKNPMTRATYEKSFARLKPMFKSAVFFDAPHVIIASSQFDIGVEDTNIGICITYGRFAAESLGLGTCWNGWTQMALQTSKELRKIAGVHGVRFGVFSIGYPAINYLRTAPRSMLKVKWID
ncbi:MAG TPA: nitroreductase family protein [Candidatus Lokiarchaeia archaeon]|nr:nitroreductase family protein [Candidatus Lokiarchaeia archaeon]